MLNNKRATPQKKLKQSALENEVFKLARGRLIHHHRFLLEAILPHGAICDDYYIAQNITRADGSLVSIQFDLRSGKWQELESESDAKSSDIISLHAHLNGTSQIESIAKLVVLIAEHQAFERARARERKYSIQIKSISQTRLPKADTQFGGE
jgi:hypothetical protein